MFSVMVFNQSLKTLTYLNGHMSHSGNFEKSRGWYENHFKMVQFKFTKRESREVSVYNYWESLTAKGLPSIVSIIAKELDHVELLEKMFKKDLVFKNTLKIFVRIRTISCML